MMLAHQHDADVVREQIDLIEQGLGEEKSCHSAYEPSPVSGQ
jgi:hypothetical protein